MLSIIVGSIFLVSSLFPLRKYFYWRSMGDFGWTLDRAIRHKHNFYILVLLGVACLSIGINN
jgi:hypothetical protein